MQTITELQEQARAVAAWLETLDRTYAAPVVVKIGRTVYAGACYAQVRDTPTRSMAYQAGERQYCHRAMFLLGRLPYSYRRSSQTRYRLPGARWPWYVMSWCDNPKAPCAHPFGVSFQLALDRTYATGLGPEPGYHDRPMALIG